MLRTQVLCGITTFRLGFLSSPRGAPTARELTLDKIRSSTLSRRVRGYDPAQTDGLLKEVADGYRTLLAERDALSKEIEVLRDQQEEQKTQARLELDRCSARLEEREQRVAELTSELNSVKDQQSKELEEAKSSNDELAVARAAHERSDSELDEQRRLVARLETREKALVEQIAMLEAQLEQSDEAPRTRPDPHAVKLDERAVRALVRLDRAVEAIERQARQEAETALKKARERAEEIVRSAETRRRRLEEEVTRLIALGENLRNGYTALALALDQVESSDREASSGADHEDEAHGLTRLDGRPLSDLPADLHPTGQEGPRLEGRDELTPDAAAPDGSGPGT